MTTILTRLAKISRELRCNLRQQLFVGYYGASVQPQLLARQCQVQRNPRSKVDGVVPLQKKNSSYSPDALHPTNGQPQPRGRTFPSRTTSLRYSDYDYDVIIMADLAYQTPPGSHQCTSGGCRKPHARARWPRASANYQIDEL